AAVEEASLLRDLLRFAGEEEREAIRARYEAALAELRKLLEDRSLSERQRVQVGLALERHSPPETERLQKAIQKADLLLTELEYAAEEARGAIREQLEGAIRAVEEFTGSQDLEVRAGA